MKNSKITLLILCISIMVFASCDLLTGPGNSPKYDYKNLVAFIAQFEERNEEGEVINRQLKAVVTDFYNTSRYEIIASDTIAPWSPRFSRDKKKIIVYGGFIVNTDPVTLKPVILCNIEKNELVQLQSGYTNNIPTPFLTRDIIWNYSGEGFYHSIAGVQLGYYDIENGTSTTLNTNAFRPWGLKGQDTLLVLMNDLTNAYLDLSGNVIDSIPLTFGGKKDWNDELQLVVLEQIVTGGSKIAISNLEGDYYISVTTGEHHDKNPVWGPEDRYILYEQGGNILVYDIETDESRLWVTSEIIKGATAFMCPEF